MSGVPEPLSNELPPVTVAVHAHRVMKAEAEVSRANSALNMARRHAAADGVPLHALKQARVLLIRGAAWFERQQRDLFAVLSAIGAAVSVEVPASNDVITDISADDRLKDIRREGYAAAVQSSPREPHYYTAKEDRAAWLEGFDAFAADLAAFEQSEQSKRGRGGKPAVAA